MFILQVQYRNPINYTDDAIAGTKNALDRLYNAKLMLEQLINAKSGDNSELNPDWKAKLDAYRDTFNSKMDDDLNTADAISTIFDLVKDINVNVNSDSTAADAKYALDMLVELTGVLGLLTRRNDNTALDAEVEELIAQRQAARKSKNWAEADRIRDLLKDMGIVIEDTREGIRWKRV